MALTKVTGSVIKDSVSLSGNVSVGGTLTYQDVTNVDALGIGTFRTGINVLAGQVDVGSNIKLGNAGVITATSFVGSGANLTSLPAQATIANNGDNRVITGGSGVNLNAESKLTFDGTGLLHLNNSTGSSDAVLKLESESGSDAKLTLDTSNGGGAGAHIEFLIDGTLKGGISYVSNASASDTHDIIFKNNSNTERLRIDSTGRLLLGQSSNYVVNPAGGTILGVFTRDQSNRSDFVLSNQSSANNAGAALVLASHGQDYIIESTGSGNSSDGAGSLTFSKSTNERFRLDSSGRFLKGLTGAAGSRSSTSVRYPHFQLSSPWSSGLGSLKIECTDDYPIIFIDSNASYANGSGAGVITWSVKDSSGDYCNTASVRSQIDDTPSNDNAPGRLQFMTTTSGTTPTTKMTISSEGYVTTPNQPSFNAYINGMTSESSNTGTQTMPFNATNTNVGGHFKTSGTDQYKFVAPVAGNYYFSLSQNHSARVDTRILKNGTTYHGGESETTNQGWWDHHHLSCVIPLAVGDKVHCTTNNQDGGSKRAWNSGTWESFAGFLIG